MKWLVSLCLVCLLEGVALAAGTALSPDGCAFRPLNSGTCTYQGSVVAADGRTYCAMDCTGTSQGFSVGIQWPFDAAYTSTFKASFYATILSSTANGNTGCVSEKMACGSYFTNSSTSANDNWLDSAVPQYITVTDNGSSQLWYTPSTGMTPVIAGGAPTNNVVAGIQCYIRFDRVTSGGGCTDNLSGRTIRFLSAVETH